MKEKGYKKREGEKPLSRISGLGLLLFSLLSQGGCYPLSSENQPYNNSPPPTYENAITPISPGASPTVFNRDGDGLVVYGLEQEKNQLPEERVSLHFCRHYPQVCDDGAGVMLDPAALLNRYTIRLFPTEPTPKIPTETPLCLASFVPRDEKEKPLFGVYNPKGDDFSLLALKVDPNNGNIYGFKEGVVVFIYNPADKRVSYYQNNGRWGESALREEFLSVVPQSIEPIRYGQNVPFAIEFFRTPQEIPASINPKTIFVGLNNQPSSNGPPLDEGQYLESFLEENSLGLLPVRSPSGKYMKIPVVIVGLKESLNPLEVSTRVTGVLTTEKLDHLSLLMASKGEGINFIYTDGQRYYAIGSFGNIYDLSNNTLKRITPDNVAGRFAFDFRVTPAGKLVATNMWYSAILATLGPDGAWQEPEQKGQGSQQLLATPEEQNAYFEAALKKILDALKIPREDVEIFYIDGIPQVALVRDGDYYLPEKSLKKILETLEKFPLLATFLRESGAIIIGGFGPDFSKGSSIFSTTAHIVLDPDFTKKHHQCNLNPANLYYLATVNGVQSCNTRNSTFGGILINRGHYIGHSIIEWEELVVAILAHEANWVNAVRPKPPSLEAFILDNYRLTAGFMGELEEYSGNSFKEVIPTLIGMCASTFDYFGIGDSAKYEPACTDVMTAGWPP